MPDFIVIKSEDCTEDQESVLTASLIWNGGVTSTLLLGPHAALMTGTEEDVQTAFSLLGDGLVQVVVSADEFLPADFGPDVFELLRGATTLLDPAVAAAHASPPGDGAEWRFGGNCTGGTA